MTSDLMTGRLLLLAHLAGAIVFYGNLLAAWLAFAQTRRRADAAAHELVFRGIAAADRWLTPFAVTLLVATGIGAARRLGLPLLGSPWIAWSIAALALSGAVYAARLASLQRALADTAARGAAGGAWDLEAFRSGRRRWARWALLATALGCVPLVLMVLRP